MTESRKVVPARLGASLFVWFISLAALSALSACGGGGGVGVGAGEESDGDADGAGYTNIVINEVQSNDTDGYVESDYVELYNRADAAFTFAAGEWYITDSGRAPDHVFYIPGGTTIAATGYLVLFPDETDLPADAPAGSLACVADGVNDDFGLGRGDTVSLYCLASENPTPDVPVDSTSWSAHVKTRSRIPDGGSFRPVDDNVPTPGAANVAGTASWSFEDHEDADDYVWSEDDERLILLLGTTIQTDADGVAVDGAVATISEAGTYRVRGTLSDGRIVVDTEDPEVVRIILESATITCSWNAPIAVESAAKTIVVLDGGKSTLTDGTTYVLPDGEDEPNAALYSRDDLTVWSIGGSLTVHGRLNDGIASKDGLILKDATITVYAADDGIRGKDYLIVRGGDVTVDSTGDGLKSDNDDDSTLGFISVESGAVSVTTGGDGDGLQAETLVSILDGTLRIETGGGSRAILDADASAKGIKGKVGIEIEGGNFTIDSADDGVHSDGYVVIAGGVIGIATGDDAIHADLMVGIYGGTISVTECYEGIEGADVTIAGGTMRIVSSDDGLNAAGDTMLGDYKLTISGGYVALNSGGDGIDANGTITMTGGTVVIHGPTSRFDSAIDYDRSFHMTGGTVIAAGSAEMAQAPSTTSTVLSVKIRFQSWKSAGTIVHIRSAARAELLTFAPGKNYRSLVFASPNLVAGTTYQVYVGGGSTSTATDGVYSLGTWFGGTLRATFTVTGSVTDVNAN